MHRPMLIRPSSPTMYGVVYHIDEASENATELPQLKQGEIQVPQ